MTRGQYIRTKAIRQKTSATCIKNGSSAWENNPMWIDGHKSFRRLAFERYKLVRQCKKCKTTKRLVVHHINKDRTDNSKKNLQILCNACHNSHHHTGKKWTAKMTHLFNQSLEKRYGKNKADTIKKKISVGISGKKNPFYGKSWDDYGGHPKGMLGKHHSNQARSKISKAIAQRWKKIKK